LRIATRAASCEWLQTHCVRDELAKAHPDLEISVEAMATQGDKILDVRFGEDRRQGPCSPKELEPRCLLDRADIAVHSLRTCPTKPC